MADPTDSGIYEIVNLVNGKRYVGSAVNLARRWRQHLHLLRAGRHHAPHMQRAWTKYGEESFAYRVVELIADCAALVGREQHYIDALKPEYNVAPRAGSRLGAVSSNETKKRIGEASKKIWADPAHREKMSRAHQGQTFSQEHRAKLSAAGKGRKLSPEHAAVVAANNAARNKSPEHRALMSAHWKGRVLSEEHMAALQAGRAKLVYTDEMRAAHSVRMKEVYAAGGISREKSPETRAKIAATLKGRKLSAERIAKSRGRKHSDETKQKMSQAHKAAWARRKSANS